jgi:hypothetical protein
MSQEKYQMLCMDKKNPLEIVARRLLLLRLRLEKKWGK